MSFSYERVNGRIMLNATVPARVVDPPTLRNLLEQMQATVRRTEGLWDARRWSDDVPASPSQEAAAPAEPGDRR
jgi:hypothetical protein